MCIRDRSTWEYFVFQEMNQNQDSPTLNQTSGNEERKTEPIPTRIMFMDTGSAARSRDRIDLEAVLRDREFIEIPSEDVKSLRKFTIQNGELDPYEGPIREECDFNLKNECRDAEGILLNHATRNNRMSIKTSDKTTRAYMKRACQSMTIGEIAWFRVEDNNGTVTFHKFTEFSYENRIDLDQKDFGKMFEVRKYAFERNHKKGRDLLVKGEVDQVIKLYDSTRNILKNLPKQMKENEECMAYFKSMKVPMSLNHSLALMKKGDMKSLTTARDILKELLDNNEISDPVQKTKALFRRAQVDLKIGNVEEALKSIDEALTFQPDNTEFQQLRTKIQAKLAPPNLKEREKNFYKQLFNKLSDEKVIASEEREEFLRRSRIRQVHSLALNEAPQHPINMQKLMEGIEYDRNTTSLLE
eukprot:TRINITY_DN135_c0_g1_i1.p1 TRINITY_DN135_c0_g1~~TRINITY_DN135_c0_g1_i1.p1  ORF type:complete len:414 (+),score=104.84 TRINITY_DN135_c0_g1_i1:116-1357(+)